MSKPRIVRWDESCRVVEVGWVYVSQDIGLNPRKPRPSPPTITWKSVGSVDYKTAREFSRDLERAIHLAGTLASYPAVPWAHPGPKSKGITLPNGFRLQIERPKAAA